MVKNTFHYILLSVISAQFHIDTSHFICYLYQMAGFYMKCKH